MVLVICLPFLLAIGTAPLKILLHCSGFDGEQGLPIFFPSLNFPVYVTHLTAKLGGCAVFQYLDQMAVLLPEHFFPF